MSKIRKLFSKDIAYIIRYALNSISIYVDYRDEEKGRVLKNPKVHLSIGITTVAMISFAATTTRY